MVGQPASAPTRRRGLVRALAWAVGLPLALALVMIPAVAWLGSASGLTWLADHAPMPIGGVRIRLDDVRGSLWNALRVGGLRIATPSATVTLTDATLQWRPAALLQRRLAIRMLAARDVDVEPKGTGQAGATPRPPADLRLPLAVSIDRLAIARLRIGPPGEPRDLGAFGGRLDYAPGRYALQAEAATPWGRARLAGTLADRSPFALDATLQADRPGASPVAVSLTARGALADFRLRGTLRAPQGRARLDARLTPFAPTPIAQSLLHADGIDPASFDPALPRAALDIALDLGPSTSDRLQGRLRIRNALPGPIDRHRLPLVELRADLSGNARRATASKLVADLGTGGRLQGTLDWTQPVLAARLRAQDLNARALYGKLAATRLSGTLDVDASAQRQSVHAALAEPGRKLQLDAQRQGEVLRIDRLHASAQGGVLDASGNLSTAGSQAFALHATLRHFDPSRFGAFPVASLSGTVAAQGALRPRSARLALQLDPSTWRGRRFTGHATLRADADRLWDVDATLRLGSNRLQAQGAFGRPADTLRWSLDAPALAQLDSGLHGSAKGDGTLSGGLRSPAAAVTMAARDVAWGDRLRLDRADMKGAFDTGKAGAGASVPTLDALLGRLAGRLDVGLDGLRWRSGTAAPPLQVARLHASARAASGLGGTLALDASLQDAQGAGVMLRSAALQLAGTRAHHTIALHATGALDRGGAADAPAAARIPLDLTLRAAGGWLGPAQGWRGQITALDNGGDWPLHLRSPATFALATAPLRVQLAHAVVDLYGRGGGAPTLAAAAAALPPEGARPALGRPGGGAGAPTLAAAAAALPPEGARPALGRPGGGAGAPTLAAAAAALPPEGARPALGRPGGGAIDLASLDYAPGMLRSSGRIDHVDTAYWLALLGARAASVRSTLVLSGDWNVDVGNRIDGSLHLARDGGDVTLLTPSSPLALGIGQAVIDVAAADGRVSARAVLQAAQGTVQASASTVLVRRGDAWGIAGDAPLRLDAGADIPSLAWTAALLGPDYRVEGKVRLALQGRGSIAAPQFSGSIEGARLRLAWPAQGLDLKNGTLRARFTGDRLALDTFEIHGGDGVLTARGDARLRNGLPVATVVLRADKLQALDRPDRQLVVSGSATAELADRLLKVTAALTADRADIALRSDNGPTLSSDVVVLGRKPPEPAQPAAAPRAVRFDGSFDFGPNFHVHGMGLDAMLGGSLRVRAGEGTPLGATGSVEVVKGQYAAYGQQLQVTYGRINFAGPVDNPGLNIAATRPDLPSGIEAGVTLTGTARRPLVKLTSNPAMPDSQILSWLVLGQPLDQVSATDIGVLQTAAAALFGSSESAPLQTRIASALGLDSVSVQTAPATTPGTEAGTTPTGLPGTVVTLTKRLSASTLVTFSRGLYGLSSIFSIRHALTRNLSIQTRAGTENAVDLFYTFTFD